MAISGTGTPGKSVTERVFAVLMAFDITHRRMTLSRPPMALSVSTPTKAVLHTDADSGPAAPAPNLIREFRHVAHGLATILSGSGNLEARTRA